MSSTSTNTKADLKVEADKTREVKEEQHAVKDGAKQAVKDTKHAKDDVKELAKETKEMKIEDAPDKLLPSAAGIDHKLKSAQDALDSARKSEHGDVKLQNYPRIQQIFKDADRIITDERAMVKEKSKDGTLAETAQDAANLAADIADIAGVSLDKLWTNWTALLTVVAAGSAGSWKSILEEGGRMVSDLRYTQDFIVLLQDIQTLVAILANKATSEKPGKRKVKEMEVQLAKGKDELIKDLQKVWGVLSKSPLWKQMLLRGTVLKNEAAKAAGETKDEIKSAAEDTSVSENAEKLKGDFKNVLQLIVGKEGPKVDNFLKYAEAAWDDIVNNENFGKWADLMNKLVVSMNIENSKDAAAYQKQMDDLYELTKDVLDNTLNNNNLKLALRESRKMMKAAKNDPSTKKLLSDGSRLITHLSGKNGVDLMDPQLLGEIRHVLIPVVIDHFNNAPLPDFNGHDENALGKYTYNLSGIRLGTAGLVPDNVKIEFRYKAIAHPNKLQVEQQHMYMYLETTGIQVALKDVKWHYNRLTIPRFSDEGTIDLATSGKGISFKLKAEIHNYDKPKTASSLGELLAPVEEFKMFDILKAECTIDDFHVRVSDAGSTNLFYEMLAGIWGTKLKAQMENLIEEKLKILATKFDRQLYDIVRRSTEPSLAHEAAETLQAAGAALGEKASETAQEVKKQVQSL